MVKQSKLCVSDSVKQREREYIARLIERDKTNDEIADNTSCSIQRIKKTRGEISEERFYCSFRDNAIIASMR